MPAPVVTLVTGGAGFIGSALVRHLIDDTDRKVVNVDKLTYAGHLESLGGAARHARHSFVQADIANAEAMAEIFRVYRPGAVVHLAAESHVDRSISGPSTFVRTNLLGTANLLEAARLHHDGLEGGERAGFRFLHVSTDEVFGSLGAEGRFDENTAYDPSSPYSASKAGADHLVRAWGHTFGLPVSVVHCANNYGPFQFPEKLIPTVIRTALAGRPIPVYGTGHNVRDWIYVEDHVAALMAVLERGEAGRSYAVGAESERTNLDVVRSICGLLDEMSPHPDIPSRESLIRFVADRPGHDWRYAIDSSRIRDELGWAPRETFSSGLRKTVRWYLDNDAWTEHVAGTVAEPGRVATGRGRQQRPQRTRSRVGAAPDGEGGSR